MLSQSLLPATNKPALSAAIVTLAACLCSAGLAGIFLGSQGTVSDITTNLIIAAIFLATAVGLWRLHPVARWAAVFLLWVGLLVDGIILLGIFNPFFARELRHASGEIPTALELAWRVWPAIVAVPIIIAALHVLGKYKADFRRARAQQETTPSGPA